MRIDLGLEFLCFHDNASTSDRRRVRDRSDETQSENQHENRSSETHSERQMG